MVQQLFFTLCTYMLIFRTSKHVLYHMCFVVSTVQISVSRKSIFKLLASQTLIRREGFALPRRIFGGLRQKFTQTSNSLKNQRSEATTFFNDTEIKIDFRADLVKALDTFIQICYIVLKMVIYCYRVRSRYSSPLLGRVSAL